MGKKQQKKPKMTKLKLNLSKVAENLKKSQIPRAKRPEIDLNNLFLRKKEKQALSTKTIGLLYGIPVIATSYSPTVDEHAGIHRLMSMISNKTIINSIVVRSYGIVLKTNDDVIATIAMNRLRDTDLVVSTAEAINNYMRSM
jgi:hypothetical protein